MARTWPRALALGLVALALSGCIEERGRVARCVEIEPPPAPAPPPADGVLRWIVVGDTGTATETLSAVAGAVARRCSQVACSHLVLTGDLFYEVGLQGGAAGDRQWDCLMRQPWLHLGIPVLAVAGNHDHELRGSVERIVERNGQGGFVMPAPNWVRSFAASGHEAVEQGGGPEALVTFLGVDSTPVVRGAGVAETRAFVARHCAAPAAWKVLVAHHPPRSQGAHGRGREALERLEEVAAGCPDLDLFLAGHDHDLQWMPGQPAADARGWRRVPLIVSGAGARLRPWEAACEGFPKGAWSPHRPFCDRAGPSGGFVELVFRRNRIEALGWRSGEEAPFARWTVARRPARAAPAPVDSVPSAAGAAP
jgi:hypothetical protein